VPRQLKLAPYPGACHSVLGTVAFLVVFFATVSTNVTVLYGAGMGLIGAARPSSPRKYLLFIALLQLGMCFLPLAFDQFIHYFEFFLGELGGVSRTPLELRDALSARRPA